MPRPSPATSSRQRPAFHGQNSSVTSNVSDPAAAYVRASSAAFRSISRSHIPSRDVEAQPAWLGQLEHQRMRHRAALALDVADEVDAGEPLPDGALGGGVETDDLEHEDRVVRPHLAPIRFGPIDGVAASLAVDLQDRAVFDAVRGSLPFRVLELVESPRVPRSESTVPGMPTRTAS